MTTQCNNNTTRHLSQFSFPLHDDIIFESNQSNDTAVHIPLTFMQESLWFEWMKAPKAPTYNLRWVYKLDGNLDIVLLEKALQILVIKHSSLRTRFGEDEGVPYQLIDNDHITVLRRLDALFATQETIDKIIEEEVNRPFDLYTESLYRFVLIQTEPATYYFLVVFHHIIFDGTSAAQWMHELSDVYQGYLDSSITKIYSIINWLNFEHSIHGDERKRSENYWREYLLNSKATELPQPPLVSSDDIDGYEVCSRLSDELYARVVRFAKDNRTTVFRVLFSVFQLLVYRYSGEDDITVMYPSNIRPRDLSELVGYYVAIQPMRTRFEDKMTFADVLTQVNEGFDSIRGLLPFNITKVQKGAASIFFARTNLGLNSLNLGEDIKVTPIVVKKVASISDLSLAYDTVDSTIEFRLEFDAKKYSNQFASSMLKHYQVLLESVMENSTCKLIHQTMLDKSDMDLLLKQWNNTKTVYPRDKSVVQIFEEYVRDIPDAVAANFLGNTITYAELNKRSNQLARHLIELGVANETIVAISVTRSINLLISYLAVLKAGGAYLPLDSEYPIERIQLMLDDSQASILITQETYIAKFAAYDRKMVLVDKVDTYSHHSDENLQLGSVHAESLMNIIYTSGSTGKPKGVMLEHRGIVRLVKNTNYMNVQSGDRVGQVGSASFDASSFEIWTALLNGASLLILPTETVLSTHTFISTIRKEKLNYLLLTTGLFHQIASDCPTAFSEIDTLLTGGDKINPQLVARVLQTGQGPRCLLNAYGPTENTVITTTHRCATAEANAVALPIGRPISNCEAYVLDKHFQLVPNGVAGELMCGGDGLARGYLNQPKLTEERFIHIELPNGEKKRLYRSGDLARFLPDGTLEFMGRNDSQVKIRGFRIELGEIETNLRKNPSVKDAIVNPVMASTQLLVAYIVLNQAEKPIDQDEMRKVLRSELEQCLPSYMVPSVFMFLDKLPLNNNGKVDRKALPEPVRNRTLADIRPRPRNDIEEAIIKVWKKVLGLDSVSPHDNFFDLGGHSLLVSQVRGLLPDSIRTKLSIMDLFKYPTIDELVKYLVNSGTNSPSQQVTQKSSVRLSVQDIAIIGMSGRFPQADSVDEFWQNVVSSKEAISFFEREELESYVDPKLLDNVRYIRAGGVMKDIKSFDAEFFGFTPREARIMDPQQRVFLECAWEALENAGYDTKNYEGDIALFAGVGANRYVQRLLTRSDAQEAADRYMITIGNEKDFVTTRVAYKLDLRGPAVTVQTACSTSLVAVHQACMALKSDSCSMALAGGVSLNELDKHGYLYQESMIFSPDGHCRPFDADARGTVVGQGAGVVVLKPLEKAKEDGDHIYAIIKGSAINNDGSMKIGFTAPSSQGQSLTIIRAQQSGNVEPETISYVEAHGTGTSLGDPIEFDGLCAAFAGSPKQFCALGSVKSMIGHLDSAAGIAGLINATNALRHKTLPPTLHWNSPNPKIDLMNSPFYVNTEPKAWVQQNESMARRAAVSSFGIGGTNAHVILEEAPMLPEATTNRKWHLVTLSARTQTALERMTTNLLQHLKRTNPLIADVAYTLHTGRRRFNHRRAILCSDASHAISELENPTPLNVMTMSSNGSTSRPIVFVFPGQGAQYNTMAKGLYECEKVFRDEFDRCTAIIRQKRSELAINFVAQDLLDSMNMQIRYPYITQVVLFIVEYSLACLLMSWGIQPNALIGHSLGEYVAATISGIFSLNDVLELLIVRGELAHNAPRGSMLSIRLPVEEVRSYLRPEVDLAVINSPSSCVLSGSPTAIRLIQQELSAKQITSRFLNVSSAFHSHLIEPALPQFGEALNSTPFYAPQVPIISSMTGEWISVDTATSPSYWLQQMRNTVEFSKTVSTMLSDESLQNAFIIEVGPGKAMSSFIKQHIGNKKGFAVLNTMRHAEETEHDLYYLLSAVAKIWLESDIDIDWKAFYSTEQRFKTPLPTYPFERKPYYVEPSRGTKQHIDNTIDLGTEVSGPEYDETPEENNESSMTISDPVEIQIASLWQKCLGHEEIGTDVDFFEIGGDSLLAVGLLNQLKDIYKIMLPSHALIQNPTISSLARYINEQLNANPSTKEDPNKHKFADSLVEIQKGSTSKTPLFLVHAIGGDIFTYYKVAQYLGRDQPVYAFRALSLDNTHDPINDIKEMSKTYIEVMLAAKHQGPFILGGHSFGGIVAYEMAQQLRAMNYSVPLLVMIDSPIASSLPKKLDNEEVVNFIAENWTYLKEQDGFQVDNIASMFMKTWTAHQEAMHSYKPDPYPGKVLFFRPSDLMSVFVLDPIIPWLGLVPHNLHICTIPGNHNSMIMEPNVKQLCNHMSQYLL